MASMHCYKPGTETCQQKCLESCYGYNKPNSTGPYYSSHSMASSQNYSGSASYGQTYHPDHNNMAKPNMNHSSYGHNMMTDQCYSMAKPTPVPAQTHSMGQAHYGHGHSHVEQQYSSHGMMTSCYGKSDEKKADCYSKKKEKTTYKLKNKYKDCNRSYGDSSGSDDSDSDCN